MPNSLLGGAAAGAMTAVTLNGEVLITSKTGTGVFFQDPATLYQFEDDLWSGSKISVANDRFNSYIFAVATRPSGTDRVYVLGSHDPFTGIPRVQVFEPPAIPPDLTIVEPDSITATEATFRGSVTSFGGDTTFRFEYRPVGSSTWLQVPDPAESLGEEAGDHEVEVEATGLEPNTEYELRLWARTKGEETVTAPLTFSTPTAAPVVQTLMAVQITDAGALLRGRVNPRNSETSYQFEWGPDSGYGHIAPLEPQSVGAGGSVVQVTARLAGLEPGAEYHFRLVATNDVEPPDVSVTGDSTFRTLAAPLPTRAFEVVSNMPTGGAHIDIVSAAESEDGDRVIYYPASAHDPLSGLDLPHQWYLAERDGQGETGWTTTGADLPRQHGYVFDVFNTLMAPVNLQPDRMVVKTTASHDPDDANHVGHPDVSTGRDLYQRRLDGGLDWITRDPRIPRGTPQTATLPPFEGTATASDGGPVSSFMSADGDSFIFPSQRQLLDEDTTPGICHRLYKWEDDALRFIGVRPDGSVPVIAGAGAPNCSQPGTLFAPNVVSDDGSRVVWSARRHDGASASLSLYIDDDGTTLEASRESGVLPLPSPHPLGVKYQGAATDGTRMFFTSSSRLTPDSGGSNAQSPAHSDLYFYDVEGRELHNLTPRLDGRTDPESEPALADRARVLGVVAMSEDGRRVYFAAESILDSEESPLGRQPVEGSPNLYLAEIEEVGEAPRLSFIATLGGTAGNQDGNLWVDKWSGRTGYASPDGSILGFGSVASITGEPTAGTRQIYVYDAIGKTLDCASCPADGSTPTGDANRPVSHTGLGARAHGWQESRLDAPITPKRWVSSSGAVFFDTPTSLVDADRNEARDIYEYFRGSLRLITTGDSGATDSVFSGASRDGETVFFTAKDALVPQDQEPGMRKLYASRVGGGFAPSQSREECVGDACQGAQSPPVTAPGNPTSRFFGSRNVREEGASNRAVRVRRVAGRPGAVARLRVRVPAAGRVLVRGTRIRPVRFATARASTRVIRVALRPTARRALARRGTLRSRVVVTFGTTGGVLSNRRLTVTFKHGSPRIATRRGSR